MAASLCCKTSSTLHTHAPPAVPSSCAPASCNKQLAPWTCLQPCRASRLSRTHAASLNPSPLAPSSSNYQCRASQKPRNSPCLVEFALASEVWSGRRRGGLVQVANLAAGPSAAAEEEEDDAAAIEAEVPTTIGASPAAESKLQGLVQRAVERLLERGSQRYLLALAAIPGLAKLPLGLEGPQSVAQALGVLAAIITVHEAGHFLAARLQGIHVTQFAIGFGPTLAKYKGSKVEYSLRAIPLGGFVAFPDDDPESAYEPDDPDLLKNRSIPERALVISAGVIANVVFAYSVLFGQVLTVGLLEQEYLPGVVIPEVMPNSAAARAGIRAGDVVAGVDGRRLGEREASVFDLVDTIKDSPRRKLEFLVIRGGAELVSLQVTPDRAADGSGRIGVQLSPNAVPHRVRAMNLAEATVKAFREFMRLFTIVADGLKQVFLNFAQTADKLSGPVAIVAVGAEVARSDVAGLFQFAAIVNINLAVVNLLPLPALDGGYLFLIALEALRGKKLPDGVEQGIMSSGILLLLALGVVLMVRDTINLGIVQQML